ncbi:hypothetical protein KKC22_15290 [Myxococcota bacterium]|nr:hypothetical protein [Myxococcota bacterium]
MNENQKHFKELADAVSAVIIALGEIINDHRMTQPTTDTPQPVVNETPAPATASGRISSRQIAMLRKLVNEKLDGNWSAFDASCKQRFGTAIAYLTTKNASTLISELLGEGGSHGH